MSLETKLLKIESKLMGGNVIHMSNWTDADEIIQAEADIINKYQPLYSFCEVDASDLSSIHCLEQAGYHFSEFRVKSMLKTDHLETGVKGLYPYIAEIITEKRHLKQAINMLIASNDDDRFSNDPEIGKQISKKRIIYNLKKSFRSWPKEFLLGIFNSQTDELIAFRSGVMLSASEVLYYQYATISGMDFDHTAAILETFTIDFLKKIGVKIIQVVSTGFNINELNRLIIGQEFRIVSSQLLMRKVFK